MGVRRCWAAAFFHRTAVGEWLGLRMEMIGALMLMLSGLMLVLFRARYSPRGKGGKRGSAAL